MRDGREVRRAIALLGVSFAEPTLREIVWRDAEEARERAWVAFSVLGWVCGADDSIFSDVLDDLEKTLKEALGVTDFGLDDFIERIKREALKTLPQESNNVH